MVLVIMPENTGVDDTGDLLGAKLAKEQKAGSVGADKYILRLQSAYAEYDVVKADATSRYQASFCRARATGLAITLFTFASSSLRECQMSHVGIERNEIPKLN